MFELNTAIVSGRLGADAEIRQLTSSRAGSFSIAVDHNFKNRAGKWQTATSWFRVVTYNPWLIDNILANEATKGRLMFVQGALRARSWEKGGKNYSTVEIEVDGAGGIVPITAESTPLNRILLAGRLGGHADIKTLPGQEGGKVASFSLAADRSFKNTDGTWKKATDWIRVVTFQPSLIDKVLAKQATKGRLMQVQGALRSHEWADGDGEIRTSIEVEVDTSGGITPVIEDRD